MLMGVVFLGERLSRQQLFAVGLATLGVLILTVSGGVLPWVSLLLALTFTFYAFIRKQADVGAMPGLFIETLLLLPIALLYFSWLKHEGAATFAAGDHFITAMLILAGPLTAIPLLLFAIAAKRLSLTTIGFMQFLAPSIQFCTGIYYGEQLTLPYLICFACIWTAVIVFTLDAVQVQKKASSS